MNSNDWENLTTIPLSASHKQSWTTATCQSTKPKRVLPENSKPNLPSKRLRNPGTVISCWH